MPYPKHPNHDTARRFRARFGRTVGIRQLAGASARLGFGTARLLSEEQLAWMRANVGEQPLHEVRRRFEGRFGWPVTRQRMRQIVRAYGLYGTPNSSRFRKGIIPPNTDRKGYCAPGIEKGRFRKGHVGARTRPMYTERWAVKHGRREHLEIKIPEAWQRPSQKGRSWYQRSRWVRKAVWVWRQAHGSTPDGHAVIQLDSDPANCELGNLECVPKSVLVRLNAGHAPLGGEES